MQNLFDMFVTAVGFLFLMKCTVTQQFFWNVLLRVNVDKTRRKFQKCVQQDKTNVKYLIM